MRLGNWASTNQRINLGDELLKPREFQYAALVLFVQRKPARQKYQQTLSRGSRPVIFLAHTAAGAAPAAAKPSQKPAGNGFAGMDDDKPF